MKIFNKFFKKRNIEMHNSTRSLSVECNNNPQQISKYQPKLKIHDDIADLIWISDGENKNYTSKKEDYFYEIEGIRIKISTFGEEEPSLVSTKLPIVKLDSFSKIPRPSYYPTYTSLTEEQRGLYLKLLENPYDRSIDIGFVFILYYGLERHLLEGDYEKAFRTILKLRDVHSNSSFQSYSGNALILTALVRQRADLALEFFNSLDKCYEYGISSNLYLFCKYGLNEHLTVDDIMRIAKSFEFNNLNYIKKYPDIFKNNLTNIIGEKLKSNSIDIKNYITNTEWKKLKKDDVVIYANTSLRDNTISIPVLIDNFKFKKAIYDFLELAHNETKREISQKRKNGELYEKKDSKDKIINVITFDEEKENLLLNSLKSTTSTMDKHFILIDLQNFYYKYRNLDDKYLNECIRYCFEDLDIVSGLKEPHDENKFFIGNVPAFKRLVIIFDKKKDYEEAIKICDRAIEYYSVRREDSLNEFIERKAKLETKLNK